jgi:hypothetical protein
MTCIKDVTLNWLKMTTENNRNVALGSSVQADSSAAIHDSENDNLVHLESSTIHLESSTTRRAVIVAEAELLPQSQSASIRSEVIAEETNSTKTDEKYVMYLVCIPPHSGANSDLLKAGYHIGDEKHLKQRYSFLRQDIVAWSVSERLLLEADERLTGIGFESSRKFLMVSK